MRNLFYIVMLLAVSGCGFTTTDCKALDAAQRLMTSDPGAALERLNRVDVSEFRDSATMARWALLYSEAIVANNLTVPTDTVVNIAIDYYGSHNLRAEYQRASELKALIRGGGDNDRLAVALYMQKEKEFMLYRERVGHERFILVASIVFLLAVGVILWMRQRVRLKSAQADALMAEAAGLKCQIAAKGDDIGRMEAVLHGLLESRFKLIDSLCATYYETQGTKAERKAIADRVKSEIDALRADSFPRMEQAVNDCRDNILVRIREALPAIKPEDYRLAVYLAVGLSTPSFCLLLDESVDVVYKRKSRLKSRLRSAVTSSDSDIMDIF